MNTNHCEVAIIWASFAGLSAYLELRKRLGKKVDIKIFDKRDIFTYIPGLHECLWDEKRLSSLQFDLKKVYKEDFVHQEIDHIHEQHSLCTKDTCGRTFDYAVIATWSKPQFFDNEQRKQNGYTIRRAEDISILNKEIPKANTITVVWGWITGVEAASIIKERRPEKTIQLVHSKDHVLHTMWTFTSRKAQAYLEKMWVVMLCGHRLKEVHTDSIVLDNGNTYNSGVTILSAWITADDTSHAPHLTFDGSYTSLESDNIYLAWDVAIHGLLATAHNAFFEWRAAWCCIAKKILWDTHVYPELHNRTNLAIALWTKDGIMTYKDTWIYLPRFTWFAKRIVEKRVLFEFKYKIMLPI
jgi:NADH dehydrogenase FAD-containing subunit